MASLLYPTLLALTKRREADDPRNGLTDAEIEAYYKSCTLATCPLDTSAYSYRISLGANAAFVGLFGLSLLLYIGTAIWTRKRSTRVDHAFTFAMCAGCFLEILGYAGRLMSWKNQWNEDGFLMQIVCLTIAPAFMAGGIYLCLRRIVGAFGAQNSRLKPQMYTRIFIPCDVLSLILQAVGGGIASAQSDSNEDPELGTNIMIAGLVFQVVTLLAFITISLDFAYRVYSRHRTLGSSSLDQTPALVALRSSTSFKGFLFALSLATIGIFWRSVYRVAELAQGWDGPLIKKQNLFIAFEGVMVVIAVLVLNVWHPAVCFGSKVMKQREDGEEMGEYGNMVSPPGEVEIKRTPAVSSSGSDRV